MRLGAAALNARYPLPRRELVLIATAVLITGAGCAARFVHLDQHFYFHDEATTSLRLSGRSSADVTRLLAGRWTTPAQLSQLQRPGRDVVDTVHSLAVDDPQHPPLFYVLEWLWTTVAGSSIRATRGLAALFGIVALGCAGWLARELFHSARTVAIAVALLAISPFQLLYSQEAREYSLWTATVAGASAALLVALRRPSARTWTVYAVALAASLYTFPNTIFVVLGHAVFLVFHARRRRVLVAFMLAAGAALVAFLPWVAVMLVERGAWRAGTDWTTQVVALSTLARSWLVVFGLGVLDRRGGISAIGPGSVALFAAVLALEAAALISLQRTGPRAAWRFVGCLVAAAALPLMLADVTTGGIRSLIPRFFAPVYLGLSLAVAALLSRGLGSAARVPRLATAALAAGVVAAGSWSFSASTAAHVWWNQDDGAAAENLAVSRTLTQEPESVLLSAGMGTLLEMSHYLPANLRIRVVVDGRAPRLAGGRAVFAYGSPANGTTAARLEGLVQSLRREGLQPRPLTPARPCCGAGIIPIPRQFWLVRRRSA